MPFSRFAWKQSSPVIKLIGSRRHLGVFLQQYVSRLMLLVLFHAERLELKIHAQVLFVQEATTVILGSMSRRLKIEEANKEQKDTIPKMLTA